MKKAFDWDDFCSKKTTQAVICLTEKEAIAFCGMMDKHGLKCSWNKHYEGNELWDIKYQNIYYTNHRTYGYIHPTMPTKNIVYMYFSEFDFEVDSSLEDKKYNFFFEEFQSGTTVFVKDKYEYEDLIKSANETLMVLCFDYYNEYSKRINTIATYKDGMIKIKEASCSEFLNAVKWRDYMKQEKFSKSDLKEGMYVVFRNGCGYKVLDGEENGGLGVLLSRTDFYQFIGLEDDLTHRTTRGYDVLKVYQSKYGKLLYEREEKSAQQIEVEKLEQQIVELSKQVERIKSTMS